MIELCFNEHLRTIRSLAVDVSSSSEIILAHLLMAEMFDLKPKIIPTLDPPEEALMKADAVLLVGDRTTAVGNRTTKIDLVEEWYGITGLPYVHGFWAVDEELFPKERAAALIERGERGAKNLVPSEREEERAIIQYNFDDNAIEGLNEFFRMAFYHGVLKDIPELKFFEVAG